MGGSKMRDRGLPPSAPSLAALLSLVFPGLGQAALGAVRRGFLFALPILLGAGALVAVALADPTRLIDAVVHPGAIAAGLIGIAALAAYHLVAIDDTYRVARRRARMGPPPTAALPARRLPRRPLVLNLALVAALAVYAGLGVVGVRAYAAASTVFVDPGSGLEIPEASFEPEPSSPAPTAEPGATPTPFVPTPTPDPAWAEDGRLNLLLMGSDAGPGRWLSRTDTMVVLSVDVATSRAALIGVPRNLVNVPLPPESAGAFDNGRYPGLLNSLYVYAVGHPRSFPGKTDEIRGFRAVTGAIQELVGVPLDGVAVINLNGFVDLVQAIGGLWIDIPSAVYDAHYALPDGSGYTEIYIKAGCRHLDGEEALEYARSRHQDSDYGRMRRQQVVLVSLARQVDPIALLPRVPDLLDIARDNLWTTIQPNDIANLAVLAAHVDARQVISFQIWPPEFPEYLDTAAIKAVRKEVRTIFDGPASGASATPKPTPTPRPCPRG